MTVELDLRAGKLSIIVPVLNEAENIGMILAALAPLRARGAEVIVVDGGSRDATVAQAAKLADRVLTAQKGRASQMNAGAAQAGGDVLLFLHADTLLPEQADHLILHGLHQTGSRWGRFDVAISGQAAMLKVISNMINWRSRTFGIATGDQAIFITRALFDTIGAFPALPLMEDVEICKRLRPYGEPLCLHERVHTSGRRWETRGVWPTIFLMWRLRFYYWIGVSAESIAKAYR
jgi:rSAM/selenodomain-associated transferase 2